MKNIEKVGIKKSLVYFLGLNLFLFILLESTPFLYSIFPGYLGGYVGFILILTVTWFVGKKDIVKYAIKVDNSWWKTIKLGLFAYASMFLALAIVHLFLTYIDYTDFMDEISDSPKTTSELFWGMWLRLPLNVISEEFYKILVFIGIFSLLSVLIKNRTRLTVYAVIITSLSFGFLHFFNYNFMYALVIGIATLPTYIFFVKYKSIFPLIVQHFTMNFLHSATWHVNDAVSLTAQYTLIAILFYSAVSLCIYLFKKIYCFIRDKKEVSVSHS